MRQRLSRILVFSLFLSISPSQLQSAKAVDILWNPGVSNELTGANTGLVPGARIRNTGLLVNKSNPDELIMKIIMDESFEDKPFSGKGRNMAMWIYWPKDYCWSKENANCEGLFTVGDPINPSTYPSSKSSEYVFVQKHNKASNVDVKASACKAPWWIESTYKSRDTWAFAVSITCLGIPKEFGWYAFSQIDIGQKDVVSDFTSVQTISYPFHELAANAAAKNIEQICVLATTGKGYDEVVDFEEQCSGSNSQWDFVFCADHTKADLEVSQGKKWKKVRTIKGSKGICEGPDKTFTFKGSSLGTHRIKTYGNSKLQTSYLNLKIYRKNTI
jgi:hypothetical protein